MIEEMTIAGRTRGDIGERLNRSPMGVQARKHLLGLTESNDPEARRAVLRKLWSESCGGYKLGRLAELLGVSQWTVRRDIKAIGVYLAYRNRVETRHRQFCRQGIPVQCREARYEIESREMGWPLVNRGKRKYLEQLEWFVMASGQDVARQLGQNPWHGRCVMRNLMREGYVVRVGTLRRIPFYMLAPAVVAGRQWHKQRGEL